MAGIVVNLPSLQDQALPLGNGPPIFWLNMETAILPRRNAYSIRYCELAAERNIIKDY
jgi:hypothetical protein